MTPRLERLLAVLQAWEDKEVLLPLDALLSGLADASDYDIATVRTYFAKGLEGSIVHGGSDGNYFVMGAVGMSPGDLGALLGHKLSEGRGIDSHAAWSAELRRLAEIGLARGYVADAADADLMLDALRGAAPRSIH